MKREKRECVVFAYYANKEFIGWYSDSQGSVGKVPKIYGESTIPVVKRNFLYKIKTINNNTVFGFFVKHFDSIAH